MTSLVGVLPDMHIFLPWNWTCLYTCKKKTSSDIWHNLAWHPMKIISLKGLQGDQIVTCLRLDLLHGCHWICHCHQDSSNLVQQPVMPDRLAAKHPAAFGATPIRCKNLMPTLSLPSMTDQKALMKNFWIFTERTQLRASYFKSLFLSTVTPSMAPKTGSVKMKEMVRRSEHPSNPLADVPWSSDWFMMGSYLDLISWLWVRSLQPLSTSTPFNDVDNIFWKEHIPKAPQTQTWKETVHSSKPLFDCFFLRFA